MLERRPYRLSRAYIIPIIIVTVVVLVGAGIRLLSTAAPAQPPPMAAASAAGLTRVSEGGQVTVKATWAGPAAGLVFTIVMDTHAVDLDGYDLAQLAALRVDGGPDLAPVRWDAPAGGHHREGTLAFPTEQGGKPVIGAQTRRIELTIRDVAGVPERVFTFSGR
jgi:hypothetical protein